MFDHFFHRLAVDEVLNDSFKSLNKLILFVRCHLIDLSCVIEKGTEMTELAY